MVVITDALLNVATWLVELITDALPELAGSTWDTLMPDFDGWGAYVGDKVGPVNSIIPVVEIFQMLDITFTYVLPSLAAYSVAHWIYSHLPVVGKG